MYEIITNLYQQSLKICNLIYSDNERKKKKRRKVEIVNFGYSFIFE